MGFRSCAGSRARRVAALALAAACLLTSLPASGPAEAAPDPDGFVHFYGETRSGTGSDCFYTITREDVPEDQTLVANGPAVHAASGRTAQFTNNEDEGDTSLVTSDLSVSAVLASAKGVPAALSFEGSSWASLEVDGDETACWPQSLTKVTVVATVFIKEPTLAHLRMSGVGQQTGFLQVSRSTALNDNDPDQAGTWVSGLDHDGWQDLYLATPGEYFAQVQMWVDMSGNTSGTLQGSLAGSITFSVAGSRLTKATGKAKRFIRLDPTRLCALHRLPVSITKNVRRAKRVQRVEYWVDGVRSKVVKGAKVRQGRVTRLRIADGERAEVEAWVQVRSKKPSGPPKLKSVRAIYQACTT